MHFAIFSQFQLLTNRRYCFYKLPLYRFYKNEFIVLAKLKSGGGNRWEEAKTFHFKTNNQRFRKSPKRVDGKEKRKSSRVFVYVRKKCDKKQATTAECKIVAPELGR
jgi:hypothetical protein